VNAITTTAEAKAWLEEYFLVQDVIQKLRDRQSRADGHHRERCYPKPVDAVLGPLDDSEKSADLSVNIGNEWPFRR
jgi:hypothetical protein